MHVVSKAQTDFRASSRQLLLEVKLGTSEPFRLLVMSKASSLTVAVRFRLTSTAEIEPVWNDSLLFLLPPLLICSCQLNKLFSKGPKSKSFWTKRIVPRLLRLFGLRVVPGWCTEVSSGATL